MPYLECLVCCYFPATSFLFDSSSTGQQTINNQVEDKEGEEEGRWLSLTLRAAAAWMGCFLQTK